MKKSVLYFGVLMTLLLASCTVGGNDGLDGFDGRDGLNGLDGQDGVNILGTVIDIEDSFSAANDFSLFYEFPQTIEVFESDVVLVYILWDQTTDNNGQAVDIWRLLPQTLIVDQGLLQYNYDHTFLDVNIFLNADFDLNTLPAGDTDNQVFRIAVLPAELAAGSKFDRGNIDTVMGLLGVEEKDIRKIKLN